MTIKPDTERIRRREDEAGCFVLLTNVPTAGDLAHRAREILTVDKEQYGTEQNYGFLKDPVIVNSLFLKKPARLEALGLILLLALLLWRWMERAMRRHVDTTSTPLPGWDKKTTERPTAFMMVTKFAGVIVLKRGHDRQLARPLSVVQQHYLTALDVPATCFTLPAG
jgi:transposase